MITPLLMLQRRPAGGDRLCVCRGVVGHACCAGRWGCTAWHTATGSPHTLNAHTRAATTNGPVLVPTIWHGPTRRGRTPAPVCACAPTGVWAAPAVPAARSVRTAAMQRAWGCAPAATADCRSIGPWLEHAGAFRAVKHRAPGARCGWHETSDHRRGSRCGLLRELNPGPLAP